MTMPTIYIPHGGGPCFFIDWPLGPKHTWKKLKSWLRKMPSTLPETPSAIVIISGHWQASSANVTASEQPKLIYDYQGFPKSSYHLKWPAVGSSELAARIKVLLGALDIPCEEHATRGFDHGVWVPMKVCFPQADIPTVQLSLVKGLDPALHLDIGMALSPLRDEGVLIIGSGMSYHNMKKFLTPAAVRSSRKFNNWLEEIAGMDQWSRYGELSNWMRAPAAMQCHPNADHLLPLMVVAGAAQEDRGKKVFEDVIMDAVISAIQFG